MKLRQELAQAIQDFRALRGAQLREANGQPVLAAQRAQVIVDTARRNLGEMTGAARAQLPTPSGPAPAEDETRISDLVEANDKLVVAALSSQELEAGAREAHRRQITFLAMVAHELGSVVVNSAGKDQGSEFIVTLPLVAASLNGSM